VREDPAGRLNASAAYEDYKSAASINGLPAMSQKTFGTMLTAKAMNSAGRIVKIKTDVYSGLSFAGDSRPLDIATEATGYAPGLHR
jgi:hypothetical protein